MNVIRNVLLSSLSIILAIFLMAGNGNGNGTGSGENGGVSPVDTGELYGDLYVILRNADGVPILDSYGCVQPISVSTGEPFQLYTNEAEDIYCELTEEMASDVTNVEFGRLNMGRAPWFVRESAFDEVIKAMNAATDIGIGPAGRFVLTIGDDKKTIDSPRENLALYVKLMTQGHWITTDTTPIVKGDGPTGDNGPPEGDGPSAEERPVLSESAISLLGNIGLGHLGDASNTNLDLSDDDLVLAASLLAAAADKTGHFTVDQLIYVNSIFGINQVGSLPGENADKTYFDFTQFSYDRTALFTERHDVSCPEGDVWILVQQDNDGIYWKAECQNILNTILITPPCGTANVSGFVQAANDALRVISTVHNFAVPEIE